MANTGIRQLTTVVGGYAKRIWYSLNGTTPTAELMSIDDAGKFKCVSEQITGLAGTGSRMVIADSTGNLSASVQLQQSVSNGTATNTAWVNIGNVVPILGFTYMIGYYNVASPTLKGTAMFQSDGVTLTQISKVDNTTIGVSFRLNAGLLQIITSTGGSSIVFSGNIIGV